jgi:septal ring factor EnvC (AmiA/AmiB activator)
MTLNEFLTKAGNLLGLAEKNLTAESDLTKARADLASKTSELEQSNAQVVTLTADLAARTTELASTKATLIAAQSEVTTLKATIADPKGEIEKRASAKALEITAGQGQPPVGVTAASSPGATSSGDALIAQMEAINHPAERVEFYRKNKAAIDAAYRNK